MGMTLTSVLSGATGAWQPIETAPKDGTAILVYSTPHYAVAVWESGHWYDPVCSDGFPALDHATHWMALPDAPEATDR
jgi:hypothetical protein